jgi:hypothetical protein
MKNKKKYPMLKVKDKMCKKCKMGMSKCGCGKKGKKGY